MAKFDRNAIVPCSAEEMFHLVAEIENYPQFISWCKFVSYKTDFPGCITAEIKAEIKGIPLNFSTRNKNTPFKSIDINLHKGSFKALSGKWSFADIAEGQCNVGFFIEWKFRSLVLEKSSGFIFEQVADKIFDAFLERAHEKQRKNRD